MFLKSCSKCLQSKDISQFYKQKNKKNGSSWCRSCYHVFQRKRWLTRKYAALTLLGGKCFICGYAKNYAALDLHHINPKEKSFNWDKLKLRKWEDVITEVKKCVLLCANCHREQHNPAAALDSIAGNIANPALQIAKLTVIGNCPVCNKEVYNTKFCSIKCSALSQRKVVRPSKEQLQELIKEHSILSIGKKYGVSDNAVRKWIKYYALP